MNSENSDGRFLSACLIGFFLGAWLMVWYFTRLGTLVFAAIEERTAGGAEETAPARALPFRAPRVPKVKRREPDKEAAKGEGGEASAAAEEAVAGQGEATTSNIGVTEGEP